MRIAIFTDAYPPFVNGVSTSSFNLANCLKANGHEVLVIAPRFTDASSNSSITFYMSGLLFKNLYGYRLTNIFAYKPLKIIKSLDQKSFTTKPILQLVFS